MRQFSIAAFIVLFSSVTCSAQEATRKGIDSIQTLAPKPLTPASEDSMKKRNDSIKWANYAAVEIGLTSDPLPKFTDAQSYSSLSPLLGDPQSTNSLQFDVDFHMNSNAITPHFAGAFLTRSDITPDMINRTLGFTKKNIKYEDELKTGLAYKHYFKKQSITLYASIYNRDMRQLMTSHDAFQLIFEGNKPFENKTASLSDIYFQNLMYNQYSIGVSKSDGHFFAGINLSFLQGYNEQNLRNPSGSLYTAPYGEYLNVAYNMTLDETTRGPGKYFTLNGAGFSTDILFGYSTSRSRFSFSIQDLGFISWGRSPVNYKVDTSFTFNGVQINDITNISGSGIQGINFDSVLSALGPKKSNKAFETLLPTTIQVTYSYLFKLKKHDMIFSAGVNTRFLVNYYAYGYVKTTFLLDHHWATSVSAGAGGYSLFNLGFDFGKKWKYIDFLLGTNNLIGCIVPMYYPGSSFYLRLAAHF